MKIRTLKEDSLLSLTFLLISLTLIALCIYLYGQKNSSLRLNDSKEFTEKTILFDLPQDLKSEIFKNKILLQLNEKTNFVSLYDESNIPIFDEVSYSQTYKSNGQKNELIVEFYNLAKVVISSTNKSINPSQLHELASLLSYVGIETFSEQYYYNQWLLSLSIVGEFKKQSTWEEKHFFPYSNIDFKYKKDFQKLCPVKTKNSKSEKNMMPVGLYYSACYTQIQLQKNHGDIRALLNDYKSKPLNDTAKNHKTLVKNKQLSVFALAPSKRPILEQLVDNYSASKVNESEGKRKVISFITTGLANIFFDDLSQQKNWLETVIMANILAKSSSDGKYVGITSLNSTRIDIYRENCHLPSLTLEGLSDTFTNLYVSACTYKSNFVKDGSSFAKLLSYLNPSITTQIKDVVPNNSHMNQTQRIMDLVNSPLNEDERYTKTILLSLIANKIFDNPMVAKDWPIILGIESKFDNYSVSSVGAVGIGQLMPAFAKDFGRSCGLGVVKNSDLEDEAVNAYLSACYYKYLSEKFEGLSSLSLVAYNAGPNSKDVKSLSNLSSMSNEPANYVSKFNLVKDLLASGRGQSLNYFSEKNRNIALIELSVIKNLRNKIAKDESFFSGPKAMPADFSDFSQRVTYLNAAPIYNQY